MAPKLRQATAQSWSYANFLLELAQRECQQRRQHRIERLLKTSKLPLEKSWPALDLKRLPVKVVHRVAPAGREITNAGKPQPRWLSHSRGFRDFCRRRRGRGRRRVSAL